MFKTTLQFKGFLLKKSSKKTAEAFNQSRNLNLNLNFWRRFSNDSKIISVESRRKLVEKQEREREEEAAKAPSYLPPADFGYTYKPMAILEESIGTQK